MKHERLSVAYDHGRYGVTVGENLQGDIAHVLRELQPVPSSLIVVTDRNVARHAAATVKRIQALKYSRKNITLIIKPGEQSKSFKQLDVLYDRCLGASAPPDRNSVVVVIGGGVVGDLAGLLAATLLRGLRIVHVPTSLLAMVDSAIGGKTGINHKSGKNLIGAFYQPTAVFADIASLDTLPDVEYCAALAEVVKYGVVLDKALFLLLEQNVDAILARDWRLLRHIVLACMRNKMRIVSRDPYEHGERVVLNYGHSFGHAVERAMNYRIRHGEAIAIGMNAAARVGVTMGVTTPAILERQEYLLEHFGLPGEIPTRLSDRVLLQALQRDKKRGATGFTLVLPTKLGSWTTHTAKSMECLLTIARGRRHGQS